MKKAMPEGTFGSLLKRKRQELALTRRAFADRLGITAAHVAWLESGGRKPSLTLLQRIADDLDLRAQELLVLSHGAEVGGFRYSWDGSHAGQPDSAWKRFAANEGLRAKERISPAEFAVLEEISRLGRVSSERQLLFVLRAIRLAFQEEHLLTDLEKRS